MPRKCHKSWLSRWPNRGRPSAVKPRVIRALRACQARAKCSRRAASTASNWRERRRRICDIGIGIVSYTASTQTAVAPPPTTSFDGLCCAQAVCAPLPCCARLEPPTAPTPTLPWVLLGFRSTDHTSRCGALFLRAARPGARNAQAAAMYSENTGFGACAAMMPLRGALADLARLGSLAYTVAWSAGLDGRMT